jgi:Response regulator containing a CheY-like receiver domain and an HTH DNA-binding domain
MDFLDKLRKILTPEYKAGPYLNKQLKFSKEDKGKRLSSLTPREYQVYLLLLEGFTVKETAKQLKIKYSIANTHVTGIYKKLCVSSRAELIINYRNINTVNNKSP